MLLRDMCVHIFGIHAWDNKNTFSLLLKIYYNIFTIDISWSQLAWCDNLSKFSNIGVESTLKNSDIFFSSNKFPIKEPEQQR